MTIKIVYQDYSTTHYPVVENIESEVLKKAIQEAMLNGNEFLIIDVSTVYTVIAIKDIKRLSLINDQPNTKHV